MFAVLEYFKLLTQKPTNLASFFNDYNITRGVFVGVGGWWGGVGGAPTHKKI